MRRDGKVRWVESRGRAYFDGAGPERRLVSFVGTVQDITERKEREEKEHFCLAHSTLAHGLPSRPR